MLMTLLWEPMPRLRRRRLSGSIWGTYELCWTAYSGKKLVASITKCRFFVKEVDFCGHVLGGGKRRPSPGKLMPLEKWAPPKTVSALRGFLGFTNFYSAYVPNYAELAAPLQEKLKLNRVDGNKGSKKPVYLSPEDLRDFEKLKAKLLGCCSSTL